MIERTFIIAAICGSLCIVVDFDLFTLPPVSLRDSITDDEVFVLSPYQLVQCLPYFMQIEPVVQEIVRPHLKMNFKFRNK